MKSYYKRAHYRRSDKGNYIKNADGSYSEVEAGKGKYTHVKGCVVGGDPNKPVYTLMSDIPDSKMDYMSGKRV